MNTMDILPIFDRASDLRRQIELKQMLLASLKELTAAASIAGPHGLTLYAISDYRMSRAQEAIRAAEGAP